ISAYSWLATAYVVSGSMRAAKRYISSRQVQKLSWGWVRCSASPAIARWKACECRLAMPGRERSAGLDMRALCPRRRVPAAACDNRGHGRPDGNRRAAPQPRRPWRLPMTRTPHWDGLLLDARLATLDGDGYGLVEDGALAWKDGRIAFAGARA